MLVCYVLYTTQRLSKKEARWVVVQFSHPPG